MAHNKGIYVPLPRVGVPGLVPGDPKMVSNPRYISEELMYKRARALLTCMIPEYEGGSCTPRHEQGKPCVPRKEVAIDPINPRGELARLVSPRGKNRALSTEFSTV